MGFAWFVGGAHMHVEPGSSVGTGTCRRGDQALLPPSHPATLSPVLGELKRVGGWDPSMQGLAPPTSFLNFYGTGLPSQALAFMGGFAILLLKVCEMFQPLT